MTRLTDLLITKLSLPSGATKLQHTFFDDGFKGFGVRVSVGGAKSFVLMHGKRRKLMTLGRYPDISLSDARILARKALVGALDATETNAAMLTFPDARARFLADARVHTKSSTYSEYERLLKKHFNFEKLITDITRKDIMDVVADLKDSPSIAQHAFVAIRTLMNWAVRRGYLSSSPVPPLRFKTISRSRILSDEELKFVWQRASELKTSYGYIVQLLILTGQRRGEIASLRRSWIIGDTLTFPIGFTKNKREHTMPIGPFAKQIISALPVVNDLLFPARGKPEQPYNGWSKAKREFDEALGFTDYTLHDLRRTFSSNLAKLAVPIHVTEKLLNHVSGTVSGVAAVYNRHNYADEMKHAIADYEAYLADLIAKA
jgi:integrase